MYPGMHSQQAAQAKAQQAQKQQEVLRQQQQRQLHGQQQLPSQPKTQAAKDPHVEESISRLLSQMRHNSVASGDDDASTPTSGMPNLARLKKEEDDMDEDELLLASEEGKKLSSKERRQLRNKVSARAFRSRRKEYIGQLEGEVAVKVQEANDLKVQNRQLMEENTRLTDLTRMLLSSQAFSGFLNELSVSGLPPPSTTTSVPQSQIQSRAQPTRKDVNPHHAARHVQSQQPQIGMALVPDSALDFSMLEQPMNTWNSVPSNDFHVFAVRDIPVGPVLDMSALSGKTSESVASPVSGQKAKDVLCLPVLPCLPVLEDSESSAGSVNEEIVLDEEAFALYFEKSDPNTATNNCLEITEATITRHTESYITAPEVEADAATDLELLCASVDSACDRIALFTSHLS